MLWILEQSKLTTGFHGDGTSFIAAKLEFAQWIKSLLDKGFSMANVFIFYTSLHLNQSIFNTLYSNPLDMYVYV